MSWGEALGWALVHSLWQGALCAAVLAALLLLVKTPAARHRAACLALLLAVLSFAATALWFLQSSGRSSAALISVTRIPWSNPGLHGSFAGAEDRLAFWIARLPPFWMAGVALMYLHSAVGLVAVARLKRSAALAAEPWQRRACELAREAGIARPVLLLESLLVEAPAVVGHLRPAIVMPLGFVLSMPADAIEAVLLHELAHIARSDYLTRILQRLAEGLLFYHPAVWWEGTCENGFREYCTRRGCGDPGLRRSRLWC